MKKLAGFSKGALGVRIAWTSAVLAAPWLVPNQYFHAMLPLVVIFPYPALELVRGLTLWRLRHEVGFDEQGLTFAWGETSFLLPYLQQKERRVPWADLRGVRTSELRVNGIPTIKLVVQTATDSFEVPDAFLDTSAHLIQRGILDHLQKPAEETTGFAVLCAALFPKPLRLEAPMHDIFTVLGFGVFLCAVPVWMVVDGGGTFAMGFAAVALLFSGGLAFAVTRHWWARRVLVLAADGFQLGSGDLIAWRRVRALRKTVTNGATSSFELRLDDDTRVDMVMSIEPGYDVLAALMNPESDEHRRAQAALASGVAPAQATLDSGLELLAARVRVHS